MSATQFTFLITMTFEVYFTEMLCSFWLSTIFLFMVIVAKSVIQIVGVFLSALGSHNYNRLLALHFTKKYWLFFIHFHHKMPLKFNLKSTFFTKFSGGGMLIVVLSLHNKLDIKLYLIQRAPLKFYAPGPLISLGAPESTT